MVILATAAFFVDLTILHPFWMLTFLVLTSVTFALFGFIIGIWAKSFEQLQFIPLLVVMPLSFLGGAFYSIDMLAEPWRTVAQFNPIFYLVSGLRWAFVGSADADIRVSAGLTLLFMVVCISIIAWIFKSGWRLRS